MPTIIFKGEAITFEVSTKCIELEKSQIGMISWLVTTLEKVSRFGDADASVRVAMEKTMLTRFPFALS
ncbi:hypothetical protein H5410_027277 [Solanum commersonii]|uniref:Uncharacterized protein n=1 Tax=Solanum commersonii TaxID=4109 RepID=A0A9J5YYS9_SOLCO|nr:hypothetical protein H5410_027277 [Solanum commersonii]